METWMIILIAIVPAWLLQNTIHEASHLLMGWLVEGRKPLGLWPYPHKYKGRFYFARAKSGPPTKDGSPKYRYRAPQLFGNFVACLWIIPAFLVHPVFWVFAAIAYIDVLWWLRGYFWGSDKCDGKRYRRESGR